MKHAVHFTTGKDDWGTPDTLFQELDAVHHFVIDAAANETNHKCARWFGPGGEREDALVGRWPEDGNIWLNPPYSKKLQPLFVRKAQHWGKTSDHCCVCLLPARTDTKLFHEVILPHAYEVRFLKGRVKFVTDPPAKHGAPFPSMIVIF